MAQHTEFIIETGIHIYFTYPKEPLAKRKQREYQWAAVSIPGPFI